MSFRSDRIIDDQVAMNLIRYLRKERQKLGLLVRELAPLVGISPSCLADYERGKYLPSIENYNKIAEFFHWPSYLKGRKLHQINHNNSNDVQQVIPFEENTQEIKKIPQKLISLTPQTSANLRAVAIIKGSTPEQLAEDIIKNALEPLLVAVRNIQQS